MNKKYYNSYIFIKRKENKNHFLSQQILLKMVELIVSFVQKGIVAGDILWGFFFYYYFSEKIRLSISCESPAGQTIHVKYQVIRA